MALSRAAWQEIRVRSGRDDKKERVFERIRLLPKDKAIVDAGWTPFPSTLPFPIATVSMRMEKSHRLSG